MRTRTPLVACRSAVVTPDLIKGLRALEMRVAAIERGLKLTFAGVKRAEVGTDPGPTKLPPALSLRPAGREVVLGFDSEEGLATLWGAAIPCGFVPFDRYPVPGPTAGVFHFLGPWQRLFDSLLGEGRGEVAWESVCTAAQVDVGTWQGDRPIERYVQAQLHRLGFPCGPVDGVINDRTLSSMRALGLMGMTLTGVAETLEQRSPVQAPEGTRRFGYVVAPGAVSVVSTGGVATTRTPHGVTLTIDGPGRVVVDVEGPST